MYAADPGIVTVCISERRIIMTQSTDTTSQKDKVVLAYSGGLDTSSASNGCRRSTILTLSPSWAISARSTTGSRPSRPRLSRPAPSNVVVHMRETFADEYLTSAMMANAMYENKYPLVSALSRPLISKHLVDAAHTYGAKYIAHGCTGKGNDQVRFEASITMLDPDLTIIAPVREWDLGSRAEEMEWAAAHGIDVPTTQASPYSIDDNLWGAPSSAAFSRIRGTSLRRTSTP